MDRNETGTREANHPIRASVSRVCVQDSIFRLDHRLVKGVKFVMLIRETS